MAREALLGPLTSRPSDRTDIRGQRPDIECLEVMQDYEQRTPLERWLLDWAPDSAAYASGRIRVEPTPSAWRVTFRSAYDGKPVTIDVPRKGTPPPPGHD